MNEHCNGCEFEDTCELAHEVNFCENCADNHLCTINLVSCDVGYDIECNNGFIDKYDSI